jgi:hypothetical protein
MRVSLIIMMLLTVSCIAKKIAVQHTDTLLEHQITKRLPLYSDQKKKLSEDVDKFLNDHKPVVRDMLPLLEKIHIKKSAKIFRCLSENTWRN